MEFEKLMAVAIIAIIFSGLNCFANTTPPPALFTGQTLQGIPVACAANGDKGALGEVFFKCRFKPGARSVQVFGARGGGKLDCYLNAIGDFDNCEPEVLYEIEFYVETDSVRTGLVGCSTSFLKLNSHDSFVCAEAYNPSNGVNGGGSDHSAEENILKCDTEDGRKLIVSRFVKDWSSSSAGTWHMGDYSATIYGAVDLSTPVPGSPLKRNDTSTMTQFEFSEGQSTSIKIIFPNLDKIKPGARVTGSLEHDNPKTRLECILKSN